MWMASEEVWLAEACLTVCRQVNNTSKNVKPGVTKSRRTFSQFQMAPKQLINVYKMRCLNKLKTNKRDKSEMQTQCYSYMLYCIISDASIYILSGLQTLAKNKMLGNDTHFLVIKVMVNAVFKAHGTTNTYMPQ